MEKKEKSKLEVVIFPVMQDNYAYIIIDHSTKECAVVDPQDPERVAQEIKNRGLDLKTVLTTHYHLDHAGGNSKIAELYEGVTVYGGSQKVQAITVEVNEGDSIKIGNLKVEVISSPCHTQDHVLYSIKDGDQKVLFTGDTLFVGGCGKFFEGTAEQMFKALQKISSLDKSTKIYCGHEYTLGNFKFCKHIEPENESLLKKNKWAEERRENKLPTVPSTLEEELSYNVFMRTDQKSVIEALKIGSSEEDRVKVLEMLREAKNKF